mmetsp:Transcript_5694/g.6796  ORF Transcript_5694/g.6796 Transcript_5694/m.6796 type:complete len:479 (+) Transcript_5694:61-1497(+)
MPAINKTPPLLLKEPANGTKEGENTEHAQINKQDGQTPNSKNQDQKMMMILLLLLLLDETPTESKKGDDESSETRDSDPENHRRGIQDLANIKSANAYSTNGKKKRASKGRVFQCTGYPDCNMSFTRSEHLARHKRKHTGERPFTCPHCHKNFSRLDNLRQHKQTVHAYENFMGGSSSHTPITTNSNSEGTSGSSETNNTSYIPIPNHLSRNSSLNKGAPESPLNYGFNNTPESAAMISPPNTNSPVNYHLPYQNQFYQNNSYELGSSSGNNSFQYPDSQLKTKVNQFKPKRRPRPLSLVHSFTENMAPSDNNSLHIRHLLKSAPALYSTNGAFTYPPKSAPLTPNMVSPLSPLFHHAFNQSMDLPKSPNINSNTLRLPPYNHPINNNGIQSNPANNNITLPPVQELPIPAQFNPIKTSKPSKTWLKEVLNDESSTSSSSNDVARMHPTQEDRHVSKKPTINNLLSPYDDEEFPNSVK